jgi:phenylacetic acid degradation operon negative regulatory protein
MPGAAGQYKQEGRGTVNDVAAGTLPQPAMALVLSIFKDLLPPAVDTLWFSQLTALATPLGLQERCLRTSLYRLVQLGALLNIRSGRRSAYQLRPMPAPPVAQPAWDGSWCVAVVMTGKSTFRQRSACEADLLADGFRAVTPGVWLRPANRPATMNAILARHGMEDAVLTFVAAQPMHPGHPTLAGMVDACWKLEPLADAYRRFSEQCAAASRAFERSASADSDNAAFLAAARTLALWRTLDEADPALPSQLLPAGWPREAALAQCAALRARLARSRFMRAVLAPVDGDPVPVPECCPA